MKLKGKDNKLDEDYFKMKTVILIKTSCTNKKPTNRKKHLGEYTKIYFAVMAGQDLKYSWIRRHIYWLLKRFILSRILYSYLLSFLDLRIFLCN